MESFHTIILGAGPGGIKAAKILAQAKKRVALISQDLGGECLNYGCIPTKTYLWTAELLEKIGQADVFGIEVSQARALWQRMKERRNEVVSKLKRNLRQGLERMGVEILDGIGILENSHTVKISGTAGEQLLEAKNIILATGSEAIFPPGFVNDEKVLSNREILDLPAIPKTLLIIGGGAVGVEFASIFAALGTEVTIAEAAERLLPQEDHEISIELERIFVRKKITVLKNTQVTPDYTKDFEKVLMAVGRKPVLRNIASTLEKIGVKINKKTIETNEYLQTNVPHIFVIGDLAGKALLAYTAEREGEIAAQTILKMHPAPLRYETVPNTIFCLPEVASVGLSETKVQKLGMPYIIEKGLMSTNSKALILGNRDGFAKIIVERSSHKILGLHLIGEKASELIAVGSLAITAEMTLEAFTKNIYSHPILGEIVKDACEAALYRLSIKE